jgi:hypothetical protein
LARTIYIRCKYGIFGREITKYTVIYGVYIRFWPTLNIRGTTPQGAPPQKYRIYAVYIYIYYIYIWSWPTLDLKDLQITLQLAAEELTFLEASITEY